MAATLTPLEDAFLRDLALSKRTWLETARGALDGHDDLIWSECESSWRALAAASANADLRKALLIAIDELLGGLTHSFLVTLDGGTQLAEKTLVEVRGEDEAPFTRGLHEFWPFYSGEA